MKKLLLLFLFCSLLVSPCWATIARVTSTSAANDLNGATSPAVDTTGASLLVLMLSYNDAVGAPTISDSKSNTWTALTGTDNGVTVGKIYYSINPTVGTNHTFTVSGASSFPAISVAAFSGTNITAPFDQQNGAAGGSPLATGSVTPSENNEILFSGLSFHANEGGPTIDSSFTLTPSGYQNLSGGNHFGVTSGYLIQTTAGAVNPKWTFGGTPYTARIATFKVLPNTSRFIVVTEDM